jgi:hypothetical protein
VSVANECGGSTPAGHENLAILHGKLAIHSGDFESLGEVLTQQRVGR